MTLAKALTDQFESPLAAPSLRIGIYIHSCIHPPTSSPHTRHRSPDNQRKAKRPAKYYYTMNKVDKGRLLAAYHLLRFCLFYFECILHSHWYDGGDGGGGYLAAAVSSREKGMPTCFLFLALLA